MEEGRPRGGTREIWEGGSKKGTGHSREGEEYGRAEWRVERGKTYSRM